MSSPPPRRSVSRHRSPTPDRAPQAEDDDNARGRSRSPINDRLNGTRSLSHSRSRSRSRSRSLTRSPSAPRSAKIVIEKLTKNVNSSHLREIFSTYGDITELEMPMNKQFMTNRGIAYVIYSSSGYAESAIAHMHEAQLDGACISVSIVLPRRRFSRSPPPRRPPPNRFGEPHRFREAPAGRPPPPDRAYGRPIPPPRAEPGFRGGRGRSPPPSYRGGRGGGGYRDRHEDRNSYRPRSYSPSRSPPPRRRRSTSYSGRSRSRSPPRRREPSPPPRGGGAAGGRRRRSPSYSSYGSRSRSPNRSSSRDRGRGRR